MLEFITDKQIYERVVCGLVPKARHFVWLATSDLKDMYVNGRAGMVPFLEVLAGLADKNIEVRLLHAKEPGPAFRKDFDRFPKLIKGVEKIICPRVHFKAVVVDGQTAYTGSANITGAGMGAKSESRRNFEAGIVTDDKRIVGKIMEQFDAVWRGDFCGGCKRKQYCTDFVEMK